LAQLQASRRLIAHYFATRNLLLCYRTLTRCPLMTEYIRDADYNSNEASASCTSRHKLRSKFNKHESQLQHLSDINNYSFKT